MKLTLAKIKTLPIGKKISDGQGLCLTKTAPNKGRWEHRYMINKRARVMALGTYPEISLVKARRIHFEQRQLLVEGKDPLKQKHRREERQRRHATLRFSHVAEIKAGQKTKIEDLSLLCSNCHRMIHRRVPWLKIEELKSIIA